MKAKCHNYSGCLKAYRGEEIELAPGSPLVCAECAKPMTVVTGRAVPVGKLLAGALGLAVLIGLLLIGKKNFSSQGKPEATPSATVAEPARAPGAIPAPSTPATHSATLPPMSAPEPGAPETAAAITA